MRVNLSELLHGMFSPVNKIPVAAKLHFAFGIFLIILWCWILFTSSNNVNRAILYLDFNTQSEQYVAPTK
jgi:hypothetical protein